MISDFTLFGRNVSPYGLFFIAGLYLAAALLLLLAPKRQVPRISLALIAVFSVIGGIIGARLLYIVTRLADYFAVLHLDPALFFRLLFEGGGFVFYGGLAGGVATALFLLKRKCFPVLPVLDLAAPAVALGQAVGRLGCLSVGCCYGVPVERWGIVFPEESFAPPGIPLFPTQIIESLFLFILTAILIVLVLRTGVGLPATMYALSYGVFRFIIEFWRGDEERGFFLVFSTSQWLSLCLGAAGFYLLRLCIRPRSD